MATTFLWSIPAMDRLTADGFVVTAHYRVDATDGTYNAATYGTVGFTKQPDDSIIPYDQLTEAIVVDWVQESLDKQVVEASLQGQIEAQKAPVQVSGTPWSV